MRITFLAYQGLLSHYDLKNGGRIVKIIDFPCSKKTCLSKAVGIFPELLITYV